VRTLYSIFLQAAEQQALKQQTTAAQQADRQATDTLSRELTNAATLQAELQELSGQLREQQAAMADAELRLEALTRERDSLHEQLANRDGSGAADVPAVATDAITCAEGNLIAEVVGPCDPTFGQSVF